MNWLIALSAWWQLNHPGRADFHGVVRQSGRRTCGAAALATLLHQQGAVGVDEARVLARIGHRGMASLAELALAAADLGHPVRGYAGGVAELTNLGRPVILHLGPLRWGHYVVCREIHGDQALIADPARGNRALSLRQLAALWAGRRGEGYLLCPDDPTGRC